MGIVGEQVMSREEKGMRKEGGAKGKIPISFLEHLCLPCLTLYLRVKKGDSRNDGVVAWLSM